MKTTTILLAAIAAILLPLAILAADGDQIVEVVAIGMGATQDAAMKAANRAAVQQVVGTMVDASTLVENDELVEDKILTYSAGLIADSKILGEPKATVDGLITVKVKAIVKKMALKEKLVAAKLITVELDGQSIFAQAVSAQENLADAEAMIKDVLAKHTACVVAETIPGKNGKSPIDYDPKTGDTLVNIRVHVDMAIYRKFIKEIFEKLGKIAVRKEVVHGKQENNSIDFCTPHGNNEGQPLVILPNASQATATVLFFANNEFETVLNSLQVNYGAVAEAGHVAVLVSILDMDGMPIGTGMALASGGAKTSGPYESCCVVSKSIVPVGDCFYPVVIAPMTCFNSSARTFREDGEMHLWWNKIPVKNALGANSSPIETFLRIPLGTFSPEELKSASKLEIKIGHMKDGQFVE